LKQEQAGDQEYKTMLKAALAAAAPVLAVVVILISVDAVTVLEMTNLGRIGLAGLGVVLGGLAFLLWRGRWWAGLPALLISALAMVAFALKFIRPLLAYFQVNPLQGLGDFIHPFVMLSPALVLVLISFVLFRVLLKGVQLAKQLAPRPVSNAAWGVILLWAVVFVGDAFYENLAWRWWPSSSDLVVRLCMEKDMAVEAREKLLKMGPEAVPSLLLGMAAPGKNLTCLRKSSLEVLLRMGGAAVPALVTEARSGSQEALVALSRIGDPRAAAPLREHYLSKERKPSPEYDKLLQATIKKLDPNAKF
jgi:hypothetical protein